MKHVYLVYGYYTDIKDNIMLRVYSSKTKAEKFKKDLLRWKKEGRKELQYLHDEITIRKETIF